MDTSHQKLQKSRASERDDKDQVVVKRQDHFKTMGFSLRSQGADALAVDEQGMQTQPRGPNQIAALMQPSVPASQPTAEFDDQDAYVGKDLKNSSRLNMNASKSSVKKGKGKGSSGTASKAQGAGGGTNATSLNTSQQTEGSRNGHINTGPNSHYQLLGIGRTMNRIDKLVRPASVLSNDRKQASAHKRTSGANYTKTPYGGPSASGKPTTAISNVGKHIQQQTQLQIRQQELEMAANALEKAKQNSSESYKKKLELMNSKKGSGATSSVLSASSSSGLKAGKSMSFHGGSSQKVSAMNSAQKEEMKRLGQGFIPPSQIRSSVTAQNIANKQQQRQKATTVHKQRSADELVELNKGTVSESQQQFEEDSRDFEPIDIALQVRQQASYHGSSKEGRKQAKPQHNFGRSHKVEPLRLDKAVAAKAGSSYAGKQNESQQEILSAGMRKFEINQEFELNLMDKDLQVKSPPDMDRNNQRNSVSDRVEEMITIDLSTKRSSHVDAVYSKKTEYLNETGRSRKSGSVAYYGIATEKPVARKRTSYKAPLSKVNSATAQRKDTNPLSKGVNSTQSSIRVSRASGAKSIKSSAASGRPQSSGAGSLAGDSSKNYNQRQFNTNSNKPGNTNNQSVQNYTSQQKTALRLSQVKKVASCRASPTQKTARQRSPQSSNAFMSIETGPSIVIQPSVKELENLRKLVENFDFDIFNGQNLLQQQSTTTEDKQVGGQSVAASEDMLPYVVFQRFCVLLLSVHGQVEKYSSTDAAGDQKTDTTTFLKQLNVYNAIVNIDETIRARRYVPNQLEILVRQEQSSAAAPLPYLQVFINTTVAYALSLLRELDEKFDVPTHEELSKSLKLDKKEIGSRNQRVRYSQTYLNTKISTSKQTREIEAPLDLMKIGTVQEGDRYGRNLKSHSQHKESIDMAATSYRFGLAKQVSVPTSTLPVGLVKSSSKSVLSTQKEAEPFSRNRIKSTMTTTKTQSEFGRQQKRKPDQQSASKQSASLTTGAPIKSSNNLMGKTSIARVKQKINTILTNQAEKKEEKLTASAKPPAKKAAQNKKLRSSFSSFGSPSMRPNGRVRQAESSYNEDLNVVPSSTERSVPEREAESLMASQQSMTGTGLYSAMQAMKKQKPVTNTSTLPKAASSKKVTQTIDRNRTKTFSLAHANNNLTSARTTDATANRRMTAESSPARSVRPYQSSPKKRVRREQAKSVVYTPTSEAKAQEHIAYAIGFFRQQLQDDDDHVEDEYLFDIVRLPRTQGEADRMAKQFADDADRWNNFMEEEDEDYDVAQLDNRDSKMGIIVNNLAIREQGHGGISAMSELPQRRDYNNKINRFSHLEKQHSDLQSKSPAQLAEQVLSSSNVNLAMIQKIKSLGARATNATSGGVSSDSLTMGMGLRPSEKTNLGGSSNTVFDYSRQGSSGLAAFNQHNDNKMPLASGGEEDDLFERDSSSQL